MIPDLIIDIQSMCYPGQEHEGNLIENMLLNVTGGQFISIIGPSGAGKTTLLRIIAGLEHRFSGFVKLGQDNITGPSRDIQIVFQDYRLLPWKTVGENLSFAGRNGTGPTDEIIAGLLRLVQLEGKERAWPKELSGGEEGRVAFARVLVDSPRVLLLDEPFRNVDLVVRNGLQNTLLRTLQQHPMTVVLVSHSVEDAVILSDFIYLFSHSPMTAPTMFQVDLPKPRNPGDPRVAEFTALIVRTMLGMSQSRGHASC